ncbi:MAG: hypothetical protein WBG45_08490 [Paenisporosarcina sp.]
MIGVKDGESSGNSRCFSAPKAKRQVHELKTPQATSCEKNAQLVCDEEPQEQMFLLVEEAEAMPAESVRLKRKSNSTEYKKRAAPRHISRT